MKRRTLRTLATIPARRSILPLLLLGGLCACAAPGAGLRFDLGPAKSDVWEGFVRVTAASRYTPAEGFGWKATTGLTETARAHRAPVENRSRGTSEPPPIWTNAITEDGVIGTQPATFLVRAEPGDYEIYLVCGVSDGALRSQFFDFTVGAGAQEQRVQIEGSYQFRTVRLRARVGAEPLAITFTPRSKFVVNAIVAWTAAEAAEVQRDFLTPFEEWTFRLPPREWAKWKEDPEPPPAPLPPLSARDAQRGFLAYTRHPQDVVYPRTRPRAEELDPELRVLGTPGEYATTNLVILPLRPLTDARVAIRGLGPVPPESIEVRRVRYVRARPNYTTLYRYRWVPDYLERFETAGLAADENARFWITLRVPEGAPAGLHRGTVEFACAEGRVAVPLQLRVLPIRLREDPEKIFGIYYRHPYDLMAAAPDAVSQAYFRRKAELEHRDMVAHGTRNVVLNVSTPPADAQGRFAFNWDLLADKLALWRAHQFVGPVVLGIPTERIYEKYLKERPGAHLRGVKDPPAEFDRELTALVRAVETERVRRGWPEFLYYPIDEPSTEPAAVAFMVKVLRACKAAGVRTYVTADPTHDQFEPMRPLVDVWCTQPFAPERETVLADSKARGVEYWCYPNHINGENDHTPTVGARLTYGFGFWRSGFRVLIPWIYQSSSGDPFNYLDGANMDFFNRSEPDGTPLPVALWEAYREGYTDYRFVHTLERTIAEARSSGRPGARQAAEQAAAELRAIWQAIPVQAKYKDRGLWAPEDFDVYRWMVAREILALQAALGR